MKVEDREILFIKRNSPVGFPRLIQDRLKDKGIEVNRTKIHTEISTLKSSYDPNIITAARDIIKALKGLVYNRKMSA